MEQYKKQLKISEELDDKPGIARATANMGNIYKRKGDNDLAIELFESNLIISKELGDKRGISIAQGNIGSVHVQSSNYEKALRFFERSIKIDMKIGFKHHLAHVLSKKAHVLFEVKKFNESKMTNEKCKLVVKEINTEEFDFNLNLLTEKIRFVRASSEDQKIAVVNALEDMVHDNENEVQCAVLHFELWIMKKELAVDGAFKNREESLKQYHSMHNKIPDYAYKQKIKKLRND
jgi:tetratricopeptide (TPR) repeat protein